LETENKDKTADLRKTIQKNNIDGVKSVFDAMIDVHQKQKQDDSTNVSSSYVDKVKNLDKYCDDDKMSQASNKLKEKVIEPSILEWLVEMGRQIAEIALNYGEALKQKVSPCFFFSFSFQSHHPANKECSPFKLCLNDCLVFFLFHWFDTLPGSIPNGFCCLIWSPRSLHSERA